MRKLNPLITLLVLCIGLSTPVYSQSNIFVRSELSNKNVVICGDSAFATFKIRNASGVNQTGVKLSCAFVTGMYYGGTVFGLPSAVTYNAGLSSPNRAIFNLPNLAPNDTIQVKFSYRVNCDIIPKMDIDPAFSPQITYQISGSGGSDITVGNYINVDRPSLNAVSAQSIFYGYGGQSFVRKIVVLNGGLGYLKNFTINDIRSGPGITITDVKVKGVTIPFTNIGSTTKISVDSNIIKKFGDFDKLFETSEADTIEEYITIADCKNGLSEIRMTWGCDGSDCDTSSQFFNVVFGTKIPNLVYTIGRTGNQTCTDSVHYKTIKMVNNGQAPAANIKVLLAVMGNWDNVVTPAYGNYFANSYFDSAAIKVKIGTGPIQKWSTGQYAVVSGDSSSYAEPRTADFCSLTQTQSRMWVSIPNMLFPGDSVTFYIPVKNCCRTVISQCGDNNHNEFVVYKPYYSEPCNLYSYTKVQDYLCYDYIGERLIINAPTQLSNAQTASVSHINNNSYHYFYNTAPTNKGYLEYEWTLQSNISLNGPNPIYFIMPNGSIKYPFYFSNVGGVVTVRFDTVYNQSAMYTQEMRMNIIGFCGGGPISRTTLKTFWIKDPSCSPMCRELLACDQYFSIVVKCPGCSCDSLQYTSFSIRRLNYGLPDNEINGGDGLADATGTLNFAKIATTRVTHGDTLVALLQGRVCVISRVFTNGYAVIKMPYNNNTYFTALKANVRIINGGVVKYNFGNVPIVQTGPAGHYTVDFSPYNLAANGFPISSSYIFQNNDSIVVEPMIRFENSGISNSINIQAINTEFYLSTAPNIYPGNANNKHVCDNWSQNIEFVGVAYHNLYTSSNFQIDGCQNPTVYTHQYSYVGGDWNFNAFPNEYRQFGYVETFKYKLPPGYIYVSATGRTWRTQYIGGTASPAEVPLTPVISGDTLIFNFKSVFQPFGGPDALPSEGYIARLAVTIRPSCQTPPSITAYDEKFVNYKGLYSTVHWTATPSQYGTVANGNKYEVKGTASLNSGVRNSFVFQTPKLLLQASLAQINATDSTAFWDILVTNIANTAIAENVWLSIDTLRPNGISVYRVENLSTGIGVPNIFDIWQIGQILPGQTKTFRVYARTTKICTTDSIKIFAGWNCNFYPLFRYLFPCSPEVLTLKVTPQPAELQINVVSEPPLLNNFCDTLEYEVEVNNVKLGSVFDNVFNFFAGAGVTVIPGTSYLVYPVPTSGSMTYKPIPDPTGVSTYKWTLTSGGNYLSEGLRGINTVDSAKYRIKFSAITYCDPGFISGKKRQFTAYGRTACGKATNIARKSSQRLSIIGAEPGYEAVIQFIEYPDIYACNSNSRYKVRFLNLGIDSTSGEDSIAILLPFGIDIDSSRNVHNFLYPNYRASFIGGQKEISWKIPSKIAQQDSVVFYVYFKNDPSLSCDSVLFETYSFQRKNVSCSVISPLCNVRSATGEGAQLIAVKKPVISILNFKSTSTVSCGIGEVITANVLLKDSQVAVPAGTPISISIWKDVSPVGIFNPATDSLLTTINYTSGLAADSSINLSATFTNGTGNTCNLIAVIDNQSICTCLKTVFHTYYIQLENAGRDTTVCSGRAANLGACSIPGYSYSWIPSTNLSSGNVSNPIFSVVNTTGNNIVYRYELRTRRGNNCITFDTVYVTVRPAPLMSNILPKTICTAQNISQALSSNPAGSSYSWTAIGSAGASGFSDASGTTISQVLMNSTFSPVDVNYVVVPISSNGCSGPSATFVATINPQPNVIAQKDTICSNTFNYIPLSSSVANTNYTWTATGLNATLGAGSLINQNLTNNGTSLADATFTVTANSQGCISSPTTVTTSVFPVVTGSYLGTTTICSQQNFTGTLSSPISGATFSWTANAPQNILGASNGSGLSIVQTLINTGSSIDTVVYTVTPKYINCIGVPFIVKVAVKPSPEINANITSLTICSGDTISIPLSSTPSGSNITWITNGLFNSANGTGTLISQVLVNATAYTDTVVYTAKSQSLGCFSSPLIVRVVVRPTTNANAGPDKQITCQYPSIALNGSSNSPSNVYSWTGPSAYNSSSQNANVFNPGTYYLQVINPLTSCSSRDTVVVTEPPSVLSSSKVSINLDCNNVANGSISLTVSGGVPSYTYLWSDGATTKNRINLASGTYSVIIKDTNLCSLYDTLTITEPTALQTSSTATSVSCNAGSNGAIDLSVTGGTAPYSYSWNGGASTEDRTGLIAGTYNVTVTDNKGCTITHSATITEPTALQTSSTATSVSCNAGSNGAIDLSVTGGTAPYSYSWNGGASTEDRTGLIAGTYNVTVTDNKGCTITHSATITEPTALQTSSTATSVSCNAGSNGAIDLSVTGGTSPYSYSWNGGASTEDRTGLIAGTYNVTVTDNKGCTITHSATITEPTALQTSSTATSVSCNAGSNGAIDLSVTGGTSPYSYSWNGGASTEDRTGLIAGTYNVTVTDNKGCTITHSATITEPTALQTSSTATSVSCNAGSNGAIDLSVTGGTAPYSYSWNGGASTEDRTGLIAGTYNVTVTDNKGCTITHSATITEPTALQTSSTATSVSCNAGSNGAIDLSVTGGTAPYSYSWNGGASTEDRTGLIAGTYNVTVTDNKGCTITHSATITEPTALQTSSTATSVSCNAGSNGAIDLSVTGGTSPYSYSWNGGASTEDRTGLIAGTYNVTVTDNKGCTITHSATITEPTALQTSSTATSVSCNAGSNGAIDLSVTGGTAPYSYSWNGGASTEDRTGLIAGTYNVTVTDNKGCTITHSATITEPTALQTSSTATSVSCNAGSNGAIDLSVTGGTAPYSYSWNGGASTEDRTGLIAGTYNVTVTDNKGCTITHSATITEPTALQTSSTATSVSCNAGSNGAIDLSVTGGTAPYSYSWNGGASTEDRTGLIAGTYNVTVTDNKGCTITHSATITEPTALQTSSTATSVSCNAGSNGAIDLSVTGGTAPYSYSWNGGASTEDRTGLIAGTYNVTVTDNKGCTITHSATITEPTALQTSSTATSVSCNAGSNGAIDLSVTGGTAPYSYSWNGGASTEDRTGLIAGTYNVTVTDNKGCTITHSATITEPTALQTSSTATSVSCNAGSNGAIDLSVTGGTSPYSYSWNGGASTEDRTGLIAGTYNVTVTDNKGCTITHSATITEPTAFASNASIGGVSCNGGGNSNIDISVTGGTSPYTYLWDGTITTEDRTNLIAGTYTLVVTDNNSCVFRDTFVITEPTALQTSSTATSVSCNAGSNGAIDLSVTGGTAPYSYSWNGGASTEDRTGLIAGTYNVTVTDNKGCTITHSATITEPTALQTSSTATSVSCNAGSNGAIDLSVTGGTSPYSYSWNGGASTEDRTGLIAGTYNVTVTDNKGCTITHSATITEPTALQTSSTATSVSCNAGSNGAIDLSVTGGTAPYSYSWNGGASTEDRTGLIAGTYNVTVTDNKGCTITHSATITEPTALQTSSTATSVSCNAGSNGAIDLSVTGGTSPYSYSWNGGASTEDRTGLIAGTYNVTVTDNKGCTITHSATITEPTALQTSSTATSVSCNAGSNGAIDLSVTGGTAPYSYSWNGGASTEDRTGLIAGTYNVTVTDNKGCTITHSATITEPTALQTSSTATSVSCNAGSNGAIDLSVTGGTAPYSYSWNGGATTEDRTGLIAGTYNVTVTDNKGCTITHSATITEPTALQTSSTATSVSCNAGSNGAIDLSVTGGTAPYSYSWNGGATTEDRTGLIAGTYNVTVTDNKGCTITHSATITEPTALQTSSTATSVSCNAGSNGAIDLSVTGGTTPYSYSWNGGATTEDRTGLIAGTYNVTVTDNKGCTITHSATITRTYCTTDEQHGNKRKL